MEDNSLLMIVLAFILGYMCSVMMKQMCGGRLVEGAVDENDLYSDLGVMSEDLLYDLSNDGAISRCGDAHCDASQMKQCLNSQVAEASQGPQPYVLFGNIGNCARTSNCDHYFTECIRLDGSYEKLVPSLTGLFE